MPFIAVVGIVAVVALLVVVVLFKMTWRVAEPNQALIVTGLGARGESDSGSAFKIVVGKGAAVIPGFVDAHTHRGLELAVVAEECVDLGGLEAGDALHVVGHVRLPQQQRVRAVVRAAEPGEEVRVSRRDDAVDGRPARVPVVGVQPVALPRVVAQDDVRSDLADGGAHDASGLDAREIAVAPRPNPMTGPFFIEGAEPGDTLAVRIDRLTPSRAKPRAWPATAP